MFIKLKFKFKKVSLLSVPFMTTIIVLTRRRLPKIIYVAKKNNEWVTTATLPQCLDNLLQNSLNLTYMLVKHGL